MLGMDKNLSLKFFTRNEVGIWSDSYLFGRIRSECVGEGKVLPQSLPHLCPPLQLQIHRSGGSVVIFHLAGGADHG
jgi:hypothetical protein